MGFLRNYQLTARDLKCAQRDPRRYDTADIPADIEGGRQAWSLFLVG
jgi:hypothetical protein